MLRIKRQLIKVLRTLGPLTIELNRQSVTVMVNYRVTRIDWPGVIDVRVGRTDITLRYHAGDASWLPIWAFAKPEHQARFLALADYGLANSHRDPVLQTTHGE